MAGARVLAVGVTEGTWRITLQLNLIDYDTGATTRLSRDDISLSDARYGGSPATTINASQVHCERLSATKAVLLWSLDEALPTFETRYFAAVVDITGDVVSIGNFYEIYQWAPTDDPTHPLLEIDLSTPWQIQVIDGSHVLVGGLLRDTTSAGKTFRWHVLDCSGVTPTIAWGYTDAAQDATTHQLLASPSGRQGFGYTQVGGSYRQMMIDVDMVGHVVTTSDSLDPTLDAAFAPKSAVNPLVPYNEYFSDVLLGPDTWLGVGEVDDDVDGSPWTYVFTADVSAGAHAVTSLTLVDRTDNTSEDVNLARSALVRGSIWLLTQTESNGPSLQMTLAKISLDDTGMIVAGVDARVVLDTADDPSTDSYNVSPRSFADAGNGVLAAWGSRYQDITGVHQSAWAAIVADTTSVRVNPVNVLDTTTNDGDVLHVVIPVSMSADSIPAAVTAVISSASGSGDQLEVTTWSHSAGVGSPALALVAPPAESLHEQHKAHYTKLAPTLIVAGRPVNEPLMAGVSHSSGSIGIPNVTEELAAALAIELFSTWRWLPGASYHVGGSGYLWDPVVGTRQWEFPAANAPYVDPAFSLPTSHGPKDKPALIFAGSMYGQIPVDPHAQFTVAIVARLLHSPTSGYYDIFSSPSAATDPVKGTDLTLRHRGARIRALVQGKRYIDTEPEQWVPVSSYTASLHRRATVLVWSMDQRHLRFGVMSGTTRHITKLRLADVPGNFDLNFFLGRNGGAYSPNSTAHMQVFDLALWRDDALDRAGIRRVLHKLNGVYGVYRA